MPVLAQLEHAGVDLGGHTILDDVDFSLDQGSIAGVTGPNGSGKTTLLRVLATLLRLDRGAGQVMGADLTGETAYPVRSRIGLIGHTPLLLDQLSLRENLAHSVYLSGRDPSLVEPALRVVGLEAVADRMADASSFGMKRRLEVARLLILKPRLLLLDESLAGLDTAASALIDALVDRTIDNDGAVVVVSHDTSQLERLCDRISNLSAGRLEPAR